MFTLQMDEETRKLENLRTDRERDLKIRHTRELEEFDVVEEAGSTVCGPWKHRTSSQRSTQEINNGSAVNGRKSMTSSPTATAGS